MAASFLASVTKTDADMEESQMLLAPKPMFISVNEEASHSSLRERTNYVLLYFIFRLYIM